MSMAATVFFIAVALLRDASADNYSTNMHLPDGFFGGPNTQTFVGEMYVTASTTYYTLSCDGGPEPSPPWFWPGPYGCINNSYTFSASLSSSRFLIPNINLGFPWYSTFSGIESFNQTATIDCGPVSTASKVPCVTTTLTNSENTDDESIISPTLVYKTTTQYETALYRIFLTSITAVAAATASTSLVAKTSTTTIPEPALISSSSATSISTTTSSTPPNSNPNPHPAVSSGSKAGASIGVLIRLFALAGIALLLQVHHTGNSILKSVKRDSGMASRQ